MSGDMPESNRVTKTQMLSQFMSKAKQMACITMLFGSSPETGQSKHEREEKDELMARENLNAVITRAKQEIDQLNRDWAGAKSRIVTMRQTGVDKIKIIPHLQGLKRLESRISQKNKLLLNIEASADTANDAGLLIETAKAQKSMMGLQKRTLVQAFNGTDVDDFVEDLQEHHDDVHEISQTLSDMQLGGLGGGGSDEVTEEDFEAWMDENVGDKMEPGSFAPGDRMPIVPIVPSVPMAELDAGVQMPLHKVNNISSVRSRKPSVAQMTL